MKKALLWLSKWDVVWSAPLAFVAFVAFAFVGESIFGISFGGYDPSIYQAAIYAAGITILFNGVIWVGMWFNWRSIYRYYLSEAINDFQNLHAWQRLAILFASYWFYFLFLYLVWQRLV